MNEKEFYNQLNIVETNKTIEQLQEDYNHSDIGYFCDVSLDSIVESFTYNGLSLDDILEFEGMLYNEFIDFYYLENDNMYIAFYGNR